MGDVADMMTDGTLCDRCGEVLDAPPGGYPQSCFDCERDLDGELQSHARSAASAAFPEASELALSYGLRLLRRTDTHYQLEPANKAWLQNIYPTNCRLYYDRNRPQQPPYIRVPRGTWTLIDVVRATIAKLETPNA